MDEMRFDLMILPKSNLENKSLKVPRPDYLIINVKNVKIVFERESAEYV